MEEINLPTENREVSSPMKAISPPNDLQYRYNDGNVIPLVDSAANSTKLIMIIVMIGRKRICRLIIVGLQQKIVVVSSIPF